MVLVQMSLINGYSFYVTTIAVNEYYAIQRASMVADNNNSFKEYERQCYSGQWTGWKVVGGMSNYINDNADLNNYTTEGMYYCSTTARAQTIANVPVAQAFSLFVERHAGVKQTFTVYTTSNPVTFVRNYYSGTWGDWVEVATNNGLLKIILVNVELPLTSQQNTKGYVNIKVTIPSGYKWIDTKFYTGQISDNSGLQLTDMSKLPISSGSDRDMWVEYFAPSPITQSGNRVGANLICIKENFIS